MIHLVRRAIGSFSNKKPEITSEISRFLLPAEVNLWLTMAGRDQRHSIDVLKRFLVLYPNASRAQGAAALLHDVGKVQSGLGWFERIVATITGPRTNRFRIYHQHEEIGLEMLETISDQETIALLRGEGPAQAVDALLRADNI